MPISSIYMNRNMKNTLEKNIENYYSQKIVSTLSSSSFQIDDFTVKQFSDENDASLILKFSIYGQSFLMTGDISKNVEQKILDLPLQSVVLKVAHHGSNTSTHESFLKRVQPSYAIISVGQDNRYGHPSKETIRRLEKMNIPYFLTSRDKTIWFEISPSWMKMYYLH